MIQESQIKSLEDKTEEQVKFRANEYLLNSKAFMLFTVTQDGSLSYIEHSKNLNPLELLGYNQSILNFVGELLGDEEVLEETDEAGEEEEV